MGVNEQVPEPPRDVARDDVAVSANRCPYCHTAVAATDADGVACRGCLARHHQSCWDEAGRCSACGGEEALVGRAEAPAASRAQRGKLPFFALVGVAGLVILCTLLVSVGAFLFLVVDSPTRSGPALELQQEVAPVVPPAEALEGVATVTLEQRTAVPVPGIEGLTLEAGDLHALRPSLFWLYHADGSAAKALLEPGQATELELGERRYRVRFARSVQSVFGGDSAVVWIAPVE